MTTVPEGDDGPPQHENDRPEAGREYSWRSHPSDADVDATFLQIVSGIMVDGGQQRHPSGGGANALDDPDLNQDPPQESGAERARRRELRRLERAAEVAAFAAREAEVAAEREADDAHFEPPDPPPLPRPKGRTIGATLMILAGIVLLARPGLLAVEVDLTLVLAVGLILGGAVLLLTGIWRRHAGRDEDDGAVV